MTTPDASTFALAALLALLVFVLGARFGQRRTERARSLAVRTRAGRAVVGEREAVRLLEGHGFTIEGRQVGATYDLRVDGVTVPVELRADYIVRSAHGCFVAEVKTGAMAPQVTTAATRRQLLEYRLAFEVDGVLLVDVEAGAVHAVEFPLAEPAPAPRSFRGLLVVCAALAAVAWIAFGRH
jgi:hypothetical protein